MEYGLRVTGKVALSYPNLLTVLILVLMEYGLRGHEDDHERRDAQLVLILVLMEYGLRVTSRLTARLSLALSLNPCFNGIWSARGVEDISSNSLWLCLNPCFNGIWSARY